MAAADVLFEVLRFVSTLPRPRMFDSLTESVSWPKPHWVRFREIDFSCTPANFFLIYVAITSLSVEYLYCFYVVPKKVNPYLG